MTKSIDELFKSITAKESIWLGVLTSRLKCKDDAYDAYQNANIKIASAIISGKTKIADIIGDDGNIHYGYYHRLIVNESINILRDNKVRHFKYIGFAMEMNADYENNTINFDLAERIIKNNEGEILIKNKVEGLTLMNIAKLKGVPYKTIWNQKAKEIYELREKYKDTYN